jgi:hypothetical protein
VTRGNVFSLASYPSPGFYVIWRRTLVNNAGQHPTATDSQSSLSERSSFCRPLALADPVGVRSPFPLTYTDRRCYGCPHHSLKITSVS